MYEENCADWQRDKQSFQRTAICEKHKAKRQPNSIAPIEAIPKPPRRAEEKRSAQGRDHAAPITLAPITIDAKLGNHQDGAEQCPRGSEPSLQHPKGRGTRQSRTQPDS